MIRGYRYSWVAGLIALILLVACTNNDGTQVNSAAGQPPSGIELSTPELVRVLTPSVVHIAAEVDLMGRFTQRTSRGVGTGVIVDNEGHILTNNHVVEGARLITITLSDGRALTAEVVGLDATTDFAVLRIDASDLHPATLGDSAHLQVGADVVAIGHALDLEGGPTVSKGVISALDRVLQADAQTTIAGLIQTDAAINPGNSGGPLANMEGQVIGINTAIIESGQGIGFAINSNEAKAIMVQLIENGFVERAFLGIVPINITRGIAENLGLPVSQGIAIRSVVAGFPAAEAGLQELDIIVALGDDVILNTVALSRFLAKHKPGERVTVTYYRGQDEIHGEIDLGSRPEG
jgi:serine protease Do